MPVDVAVNNGVIVTKHRLIILNGINIMFTLHEAATCTHTHTSFLLKVKDLDLHIDPFCFVTVSNLS